MRRRDTRKKTLCLIMLASAVFCSHILSKYTTSSVGNSSGSIAKWHVELTSNDSGTLNLVSGNNAGSYTINIKSLSEVAAGYSVIVSNVPSGMEVKIDSGAYYMANASGIVTFSNVGTFAANDSNSTHTHVVTFNSPLGSNLPNANNIDIDVRFIQSD